MIVKIKNKKESIRGCGFEISRERKKEMRISFMNWHNFLNNQKKNAVYNYVMFDTILDTKIDRTV